MQCLILPFSRGFAFTLSSSPDELLCAGEGVVSSTIAFLQ